MAAADAPPDPGAPTGFAARPLPVQCAVYLAFAMPVGMMGPGWPEVRQAFDRPAGALGMLALAYGLGRLVTSASALVILGRATMGVATAVLCGLLAVADVLAGVTRSFPLLVVAAGLIGIWSGCLDSMGARFQTVIRHVGSAGLMFGSYGVGATLAPALVALTSWTTGFTVAAGVAVVAGAFAVRPTVRWPADLARKVRDAAVPVGVIPKVPLVLSLVCFAAYVSIEVVTGNWAATYLDEYRGASARWTGIALSGFWAGMTLGRLLLGRVRLRSSTFLTVAGTVVLVLLAAVPILPTPAALVTFTAIGLFLAGMFPTLLSTTADRVGVAATPRVSGWQLLVANLAATGLTAAVGVLVDAFGPGAPMWVILGAAVVGLPVLLAAIRAHPAAPAPA